LLVILENTFAMHGPFNVRFTLEFTYILKGDTK
jgi:hypothetical protein